jgi:hypothetical protein
VGTLGARNVRSERTSAQRWSSEVALKKKPSDNKPVYKAPKKLGKGEDENPRWLLPTALTLLIIGPTWIVVYYISKANYPLPIGDLNLLVGFAFMAAAMVLLTRWK